MKSKQNLTHVIQLCGRKKGILYITVEKFGGKRSGGGGGGVKSCTPI